MNRTYKTVFNRRLNVWQAVAETASGAHKGGRSRTAARAMLLGMGLTLTATAQAQTTIDGGATVTVPGSQTSPWNVVGSLVVGYYGTGTLNITSGGTVSNTSGYVGLTPGSTGTVTVDGSGSAWTNSGLLYVGQIGSGTLNIQNGASVGSSYTLICGHSSSNGTLNLAGTAGAQGVLETGYISRGNGSATFNWNGGILRATGNQSNFLRGFSSGDVNIQNRGAYIDSNGFDIGISTDLTGTGGLTKLGAGTLTLTGNNIYSGATTISAGTLQIGNGGTSGSIAGNITNDSALVFSRSDAVTYAGSISGVGSLTKLGTGTLTLTGVNTYSGGTTINAGFINLSSLSRLGGGSVTLNGGGLQWSASSNESRAITLGSNGGTFDTNGNTVALGGTISGTGGLTKQGAGTLVLNAVNAYAGDTSVLSGTLQVGAMGALTYGGAVNIGNSGVLDLNGYDYTAKSLAGSGSLLLGSALLSAGNSDASTLFSGTISGTGGSLTKQGTGTLTLTGNNTYTGGTTISAGTLQIGNGGTTGSITGNIANNGMLIFNRSDAVAYGSFITGTGSLIKQGAGTLTMAGGNTWTGNTTVSAGTLQLASYIQSSGQTLGIGATSTANYGKLNVTGNANFNVGANIAVDVASVNTLATGQTLSGVVTAGTLTASTFNVTDNSALFNFNAILNGNALDLAIVSAASTGAGSGIYGAVNQYGLAPASGAAIVLDGQVNGTPTTGMAPVVNALGQLSTMQATARATAQTLPVNFGVQSIQNVLSAFGRTVSGRLGVSGIAAGDEL